MKWNVAYDAEGNPVACGYSAVVAPSGGRVEAMDDADDSIVAAVRNTRAQAKVSAMADAKAAVKTKYPEVLTLLEKAGLI